MVQIGHYSSDTGRGSMTRWAAVAGLASTCVALGCTMSHDVRSGFDFEEVDVGSVGLPLECEAEIEDSLDGMPDRFSCAELYSDMKRKTFAEGVREYTPAYALWSDGADKTRWFQLPRGKKIDASDPTAWSFPIGTRAFKEFRIGEKRVETRLFKKAEAALWTKATYVWNDDETEAERQGGKNIQVDGQPYYVPSNIDCEECHKGAKDRMLGIEQVSLGLPGAEGVTLDDLVDDGLLSGFEGPSSYEIGDDGTGLASEVFGAIHINCGVTCHNGNPASGAHSRGMRLTLDPAELDGRDSSEFAIVKTTVNQDAVTLRWLGQKRVVPGKPEESLLFKLISQRGDDQDQMPPLATRIPDSEFVNLVREWIESLPATVPTADATTEGGE